MALDTDLADRMRAVLAEAGTIGEVRMFGGLCFMLNGNMVAGTSKHGLLIRVGADGHAAALARPNARPMAMGGKPMAGYVFVDPPPADEAGLREWLEIGVAFVRTLPPKQKKPGARSKRRVQPAVA